MLLSIALAILGSGEITPYETALLRAGKIKVGALEAVVAQEIDDVFAAAASGDVDLLDASLAEAISSAVAVQSGVATWGWSYLQAVTSGIAAPPDYDSQFPGGTIQELEHGPILASFIDLNAAADSAWRDFDECLKQVKAGETKSAVEAFKRAQLRSAKAVELTGLVGEQLWLAITTDPPPPPSDDWPTLEDIPKGQQPAQWSIAQAIKNGPDADGVYRARLPEGRYRGVGFAKGWIGPPLVDPRPMGDALLEVYGHPGGGTVIHPQTDSNSSDGYAHGWGTSWAVNGVPGWSGRIHHYDLTIEGSGGNAVEIGDYCPSPGAAPVTDCRFFNCLFTGIDGVRSNRPISANYAGLGFYGCTWRYTAETACEHGVYTRNCLWLSLVDCEIDGIGAQFVQTVNRMFEFDEDCYWQPAVGGTLLLERCVFRNPGLHGGGCGGGPGAGLTIAGSTWHTTIRDVVILDDGTGKDHAPHGKPGTTYGGATVWSGGLHKTGKFPDGKPNGFQDIDGLLIWMKDPNRSPLGLSQCQGAKVRNSYICGGPNQVRPIDIDTNAGPVSWGAFSEAGRLRLINEFGVDPSDMLIPDIRIENDGEHIPLGPANLPYSLN